ncbi:MULTISPECIES: hypothetical protein [Acinetobacter]|jgi:hypothetical protein|uniref:hypothetical protein n=1 Tax=Acinetobacter TaxID=469 RepID=UPI0008F52C3D|nr:MULTISPECIES: hypothetical protein [Acinetobacter]AWD71165.1 hypothetical protein C0119_13605 [Acinetobacter schindleri]MDP1444622.1 hypothetical protein [Acinetobacter schindleri]OIJ38057.1 hypothetical protein BK820_07365 [Acinetobacter sp. LCT-H3]RAZ04773.1 hypothetical protein C8322_06680 [Acinetobacter sp. SM1B]
MFDKISALFKSNKPSPALLYLEENNIQYTEETGYIVDGINLNQELGERLEYLSNRRMKTFDDLKELYSTAMIINEKIDLEIANQRFNSRLGNTEENLLQFKVIVKKLNDYYRNFLREKK